MCTRATMSKLCETDSGYKRRDGWEKLPEVLISKGIQRLRQFSISPYAISRKFTREGAAIFSGRGYRDLTPAPVALLIFYFMEKVVRQ